MHHLRYIICHCIGRVNIETDQVNCPNSTIIKFTCDGAESELLDCSVLDSRDCSSVDSNTCINIHCIFCVARSGKVRHAYCRQYSYVTDMSWNTFCQVCYLMEILPMTYMYLHLMMAQQMRLLFVSHFLSLDKNRRWFM